MLCKSSLEAITLSCTWGYHILPVNSCTWLQQSSVLVFSMHVTLALDLYSFALQRMFTSHKPLRFSTRTSTIQHSCDSILCSRGTLPKYSCRSIHSAESYCYNHQGIDCVAIILSHSSIISDDFAQARANALVFVRTSICLLSLVYTVLHTGTRSWLFAFRALPLCVWHSRRWSALLASLCYDIPVCRITANSSVTFVTILLNDAAVLRIGCCCCHSSQS